MSPPDHKPLDGPPTSTADEPRSATSAPTRPFGHAATVELPPTLPSPHDAHHGQASLAGHLDADAIADVAHRYQLRDVLGAGGMGEVRLCRDQTIGRDVAVKTMLDPLARSVTARHRFLREARVQGQLEHPSVVPVYDVGATAESGPYFTMRRVRGRTLAEVLDALARGEREFVETYSRRKLLEAFVRVCLAIDYAHTRGVLHRDLKPANIMLGDFGEVYVLDWGIARLTHDGTAREPIQVPHGEGADHRGTLSAHGVVGTPGYMSPEQALGHSEGPDVRSDVYALGAILFELLTLRCLHSAASLEELMAAALVPAPRASTVAADVPPELDDICARALAFDAALRTASARELAASIERYLDGDRDTERRRQLAAEHAQAAQLAFAQVEAEAASAETTEEARSKAVRDVTAALALDPENAEARRLLVRLFLDVPSRVPPEVEEEMAATRARSREAALRFGTYGLATWMLMGPLVMLLGVRSWLPVLCSSGLSVLAVGYALWCRRRARLTALNMLGLAVLVLTEVASVAWWMGPFVLVPQAISIVTLWIAFQCRPGFERWTIVVLGTAAVAGPFALEWLGVFPPAYQFGDDRVTLFARALHLSPHITLLLLVYVSMTFVSLPAIFISRVRDALTEAERRLFLQAWHLRKLATDQPPERQ